MGGDGPFSFPRGEKSSGNSPLLRASPRTRLDETAPTSPCGEIVAPNGEIVAPNGKVLSRVKKKGGGTRLWLRLGKDGNSELHEWDRSEVMKRVTIPSRDLRILGPVFSQSSHILGREKAMVVNLEYIKAIVTAEEVFLLDPFRQEVLAFVDQLRRRLPKIHFTASGQSTHVPEANESLQAELPFEFYILEVALEVVCTYLESSVDDLERAAYPVLDALAKNVSTKNLEHVRNLKSILTHLLARVQKVRDEIEHLLDDDEDMTQLYLTRKLIQNQQSEALLGVMASNSITTVAAHLRRLSSVKSGSLLTCKNSNDVEDMEMLLEAYFMQLDGTRNKILSVREYIDDTKDYVNIQLDNHRNELIQLQLTITIFSFAIAVETLLAGFFGMNIPCFLYEIDGIFNHFVAGITVFSVLVFLIMLGYARWKRLLGP